MNSIELIAAFSGADASHYESLFSFSEACQVVDVEIYAIGNEDTNAQYSAKWEVWKQTHIILKLITADGYEGISGVTSFNSGNFSDSCLLELQSITSDLCKLRTMDPVKVGVILAQIRSNLSDLARSSIDIALWDLVAKRANISLASMLGAKRNSIKAYASLPCFESLSNYSDAVKKYAKIGYTVFKFHVWGDLNKDTALVKSINKEFKNSDYQFMVDLESTYSLDDAVKLGQTMDQDLFIFIEAPIDDHLLQQYRKLREILTIPIVPDGFELYSAEFINQGIREKSWSAGRFDATIVGGITESLRLMIIANEANLPIELQSWGYTLVQLANLHLMLANERSQYFETPTPINVYNFAMKGGIFFDRGFVFDPNKHGLGIEVDWDELATADYYIKVKKGIN